MHEEEDFSLQLSLAGEIRTVRVLLLLKTAQADRRDADGRPFHRTRVAIISFSVINCEAETLCIICNG